jgi:hypothetical protein
MDTNASYRPCPIENAGVPTRRALACSPSVARGRRPVRRTQIRASTDAGRDSKRQRVEARSKVKAGLGRNDRSRGVTRFSAAGTLGQATAVVCVLERLVDRDVAGEGTRVDRVVAAEGGRAC